jgi:hypothetical protein
VDFTIEPQPPIIQKDLSAVMTATDTQINTFDVNGNHFEMLQIGAASSTAFTPSATGWLIPVGATNGNGLAFCQGSMNVPSTKMKFTTGTDSFFIKVKLVQTVLADTDVVMVGFREAGTTQVTTDPATAKTDYDHKVLFGVNDNAGAMIMHTSTGAGVDVDTTPTNVLNVTAVATTWEVRVSAAGLVSVLVDGTADALVTAAAKTLTAAKVLVPHIILVSTGAGVEKVELVTYECGLLGV